MTNDVYRVCLKWSDPLPPGRCMIGSLYVYIKLRSADRLSSAEYYYPLWSRICIYYNAGPHDDRSSLCTDPIFHRNTRMIYTAIFPLSLSRTPSRRGARPQDPAWPCRGWGGGFCLIRPSLFGFGQSDPLTAVGVTERPCIAWVLGVSVSC